MNITNRAWLLGGAISLMAFTAAAGAAQHAAQSATLAEVVRHATEDFQDVANAEAAGYVGLPSCVSGPQEGAMGIHYVNAGLIGDDEVQAESPGERGSPGNTRAVGAAVPLCRQSEPIRPARVLRAARLGVEGQPQRDVRRLEPQSILRRIHCLGVDG
jgi:hypothetical protein